MADLHAHITPEVITGIAQEAFDDFIATLYLRQWFPFLGVSDIEFALRQMGNKSITVAEYRAHDAESKISSPAVTGQTLVGEIPSLSIKSPLTAYRQLRLRANAGDAILEQATADVSDHVEGIVARLAYAMGDAVSTGAITYLTDRGMTGVTTNYNRDGANTTAAPIAWTSPGTAQAFDDVMNNAAAYKTITNHQAWGILISQTYLSWYLQNDQVRASVGPVGTVQGTTVSRATIRDVNNLHEDHGLPQFIVFDDHYNGNRVTPENEMIFLPPPTMNVGKLLGAPPLEADGLNLSTVEQQGVIGTKWQENDPPTLWTRATALQLPALGAPNKFLKTTLS